MPEDKVESATPQATLKVEPSLEYIDMRLRLLEQSRPKPLSRSERIVSFVEKLLMPLAIAGIGALASYTSVLISDRGKAREIDQKYIQLYFDYLTDPSKRSLAPAVLKLVDPEQQAKLAGFEVRLAAFESPANQDRMSKILQSIQTLSDPQVMTLTKTSPVNDPEVDEAVAARDPDGLRFTDVAAARDILALRAVLGERNDETLTAWERAVGLP